jgi:DNA-binding GntR family transcriptional regulator
MKHIMRLRLFSLSMSERLYQSYQEHLRIFEAVKKRDVLGAEEAMKQHIADAGKFVYQLFIRNNKTIVPAVNRSGEFKA